MNKQTVEFAVVTENKIVTQIGRSTILQPKPKFRSKPTNWVDDGKLLKANRA